MALPDEPSASNGVGPASSRTVASRSRRGLLYLGLTNGYSYVVRLARIAILARLLGPEAFGTFALAFVLLRGLDMATSFGPDRHLVQTEQCSDALVSSVWLFNVARGVVLAAVLYACAPAYARWVDAANAIPVIHVLSLVPVFIGLVNPTRFVAERELRFGRVSLYESFAATSEAVVTIALALIWRDVAALAWGFTGAAVANAAFSYVMLPLPRRVRPSREALEQIFSVGRYFVVVGLGSFVMTQGDNLMIGAMLGATTLGYYVLAYEIAEAPTNAYSKIMSRVALPMFSRLQDHAARQKRVLEMWLRSQSLLVLPITFAFLSLGPPVVLVLYGARMATAGVLLQALALCTFGRSASHIVVPFLFARGRYSFSASSKVIEVAVFVAGTWLGIKMHGAVGGAIGAGVGYAVAALLRLGNLVWNHEIRLGTLLRAIGSAAVAAVAGAGAAFAVRSVIVLPTVAELAAGTAAFVLVFALVTVLIQRRHLGALFRVATGREQAAASP